jgi:hypothetical protein
MTRAIDEAYQGGRKPEPICSEIRVVWCDTLPTSESKPT